MAERDYYSILGVQPDAEDIVIRAAYKALAQRYHPDRWTGDPAQAHVRMAAINEAYGVLGVEQKRQAYDQARAGLDGAELREEKEQEQAFDAALSELEGRWQIACTVYPELATERAKLNVISRSLAFAFVSLLIETKSFAQHTKIARQMEHRFLERYFGRDRIVIEYARSLILSGHRKEARFLNQLVNVLGSETDPHKLIAQVEKRYDDLRTKGGIVFEAQRLARVLKFSGRYDDARDLAAFHGYDVQQVGDHSRGNWKLRITSSSGDKLSFGTTDGFVEWVTRNLANHD